MTCINPNSAVPLYKQVVEALSEKICRQEYKPGDKFLSESEMMKEFGVSRVTVRAAISELVEDGVLERSRGKGTFVALPTASHPVNDDLGFNYSCIQAGKTPSTRLLSIEWVYPTERIKDLWKLSPETKIIRSRRLRYVDEVPTMIEVNHYKPKFAYLFEEDLNQSLYDALTRHHCRFQSSKRTIEVCSPTVEECHLLGISPKTPLLLFRDYLDDMEGNPLFLSKQIYTTQHMKFYL